MFVLFLSSELVSVLPYALLFLFPFFLSSVFHRTVSVHLPKQKISPKFCFSFALWS